MNAPIWSQKCKFKLKKLLTHECDNNYLFKKYILYYRMRQKVLIEIK